MTKGDILFLQSLVDSHKRVVAADCAARHLDHSAYTRRIRTAEMRATRIIRSMGYR